MVQFATLQAHGQYALYASRRQAQFSIPLEQIVQPVTDLTIDWTRSIMISTAIDDELVRDLAPKILRMRQESPAPITIAIDSPGGSLRSLEVLLGLLTGSDQDGKSGAIITVATNRAYSAAASFVAFGDYAVSMQHAQILYHDVRVSGIEDVTPEKARSAARSLQDANDEFSLRLAHKVIERLIWVYIDCKPAFEHIQSTFPKVHGPFSLFLDSYAPQGGADSDLDIASFATTLWARLSTSNDTLVRNVMERLRRWIFFSNVAKTFPAYRAKGSRFPGLLDGCQRLHGYFVKNPDQFAAYERELKLLLCLVVSGMADNQQQATNFPALVESAAREFGIFESMNDPKHIKFASDLMQQHKTVFMPIAIARDIDSRSEEEIACILDRAAPHVRLFWHFCVLLCRELFEGEHVLTPADAQLLGLVDEVCGGGPIRSLREFRISLNKTELPAIAPGSGPA